MSPHLARRTDVRQRSRRPRVRDQETHMETSCLIFCPMNWTEIPRQILRDGSELELATGTTFRGALSMT